MKALVEETEMLNTLALLLKKHIKDKSKAALIGKYAQIVSRFAAVGNPLPETPD